MQKKMAESLITAMAPLQERRNEYAQRPERVAEIIVEGGNKARAVAQKTMEAVRSALNI